MIIGYARASTLEQSACVEAQVRDLKEVGCDHIYQEQVSARGERPQLEQALKFAREGDVFVVTKVDRLARSMKDLMGILSQLEEKGVCVRILNLNLDTLTPTGKMIVQVLGSIAEFEREIMLDRQKEGIAKAKREGKFKGRAPKPDKIREVILRLNKEGCTKASIATQVGVGVATVYRVLAATKK